LTESTEETTEIEVGEYRRRKKGGKRKCRTVRTHTRRVPRR